jgi:hypothetical protein
LAWVYTGTIFAFSFLCRWILEGTL